MSDYIADARNILPNGLTLLQVNPDCAARLDSKARDYGWLYIKGADGQWVTHRKLSPAEIEIADDQAADMADINGLRTELAKLREQEPIGVAVACNKDSSPGFTVAVFSEADVPAGSSVYASPIPAPDCRTCANRGRVNGLSQESYCDSCIYQGRDWRQNHFVDAVKRRCEACAILPCSCK